MFNLQSPAMPPKMTLRSSPTTCPPPTSPKVKVVPAPRANPGRPSATTSAAQPFSITSTSSSAAQPRSDEVQLQPQSDHDADQQESEDQAHAPTSPSSSSPTPGHAAPQVVSQPAQCLHAFPWPWQTFPCVTYSNCRYCPGGASAI